MKRLALAAVVAACLSISSTALAATVPNGVYQTQITSGTYGGVLKGTWTISFAHGTYSVTDKGAPVITGVFKISGNEMTLTDKKGKDACPGSGTYSFKLAGNSLKFARVKDSKACTGRIVVLAGSFTKTSM